MQTAGMKIVDSYSIIFANCLRRLLWRAVAEDVTSEVFLRVAGQIAEFPGTTAEDFRRWLFRITTNQINAWLRQTIRRRDLLKAAVELGQVDASASIAILDDDSPVDWQGVYRAIGQLSETEQSIISLRFFGGLKHNQIAEVLSLSSISVRMTLSRSLAKLRKRLQVVERAPIGNRPVFALEQLVDRIVNAGTARWNMVLKREGIADHRITVSLTPNGYRLESNLQITVVNWDTGKGLGLFPQSKQAVVMSVPKRAIANTEIDEFLKMQDGPREAMLDAEQNVDSLGEQAFGRKKLIGFRFHSSGRLIDVWADPRPGFRNELSYRQRAETKLFC